MKELLPNFTNRNECPDSLQNFDLFGASDQFLINCPEHNVKIHPQILNSLMQIIDSAKNAGFDLRVASGFRSFERQLHIWNSKANGIRPVLDETGNTININMLNDDEKVFAILQWSALPGASRHHWGTDIDVYDASRMAPGYELQLTLAETEDGGPFAEFHLWLTQELEQGSDFYRPYIPGVGGISPEPWHLSYAPLAHIFAAQLTQDILREKIQATDILLKENILKNLDTIFNHYIKPYQ